MPDSEQNPKPEAANPAVRPEVTTVSKAMPAVYDELRRLAASYMRNEPKGRTLQPTALVHEAYAKLAENSELEIKSHTHFCALAAQAMRWVLTDHQRQRLAAKRGGAGSGKWQRITLHDVSAADNKGNDFDVDMMALEEVLKKLGEKDERACRIVELRYLAGMTIEETAEAMDLSIGTVKNEWRWSRAYLLKELTGQSPADDNNNKAPE